MRWRRHFDRRGGRVAGIAGDVRREIGCGAVVVAVGAGRALAAALLRRDVLRRHIHRIAELPVLLEQILQFVHASLQVFLRKPGERDGEIRPRISSIRSTDV